MLNVLDKKDGFFSNTADSSFNDISSSKGNQLFAVAQNMRYLVPALYLFSAAMQFVGLALVYNLDKKTLATMQEELAARK